jgi:hypothetical protein
MKIIVDELAAEYQDEGNMNGLPSLMYKTKIPELSQGDFCFAERGVTSCGDLRHHRRNRHHRSSGEREAPSVWLR